MGLLTFKILLIMCWMSFFIGIVVSWRSQKREESILVRAVVAFMWGLVPVGACFIFAFLLMLFVEAVKWTLTVLSL